MIVPATSARPASYETGTHAALLPPGVIRSFVLVTGLFFLWGIPNNVNDVLIRQFMKSFAISRFQAGLVQSAFYMGYFLLALPAGILMKKRGYKAGFLTGLLLFATGCFLFLPAANSGSYNFFLAALFVVASGLAFLETASNPFIAQLGPSATSEQRLNLSQAFNPLGAIAGVLCGTLFIFSGIELTPTQTAAMQLAGTYTAYLHQETMRVVTPYLVLGGLALVWAVLIGLTKFPAFIQEREHQAAEEGGSGDSRPLFRSALVQVLAVMTGRTPLLDLIRKYPLFNKPHFLFAILAEFLYVGSQVGTWSYFISYAVEYTHAPERTAGFLLTGTLVMFGIGRFGSTALMRHIAPAKLMTACALINVALVLVGIFVPGWTGLIALFCTSLFMAMMFPTIFAMGLKDLGPNTNIGGGFLIMSIVGGAVLTPIMGLIAERFHGTAWSYAVPLCGFAVIAAFARYMASYNANRLTVSTFDV